MVGEAGLGDKGVNARKVFDAGRAVEKKSDVSFCARAGAERMHKGFMAGFVGGFFRFTELFAILPSQSHIIAIC